MTNVTIPTSLREQALSLAEAAKAVVEQKRQAEEARRVAELERSRQRLIQTRLNATEAVRGLVGDTYEISEVTVHREAGHDGVGLHSWDTQVRVVVDGLEFWALCPGYAAGRTKEVAESLGETKPNYREWVFTLDLSKGKRFTTLEGLGEALMERDRD